MSLLSYCATGLVNHIFPGYKLVDTNKIKIIETEYGKFHYSEPLQNYPNLFDDVASYKIDDLRPDDTVLDLGACIGASTIMFARKCKKVYAVEPLFPDELNENIKLNEIKNIEVFPYSLGDLNYINFCGRSRLVKSKSFEQILNRCEEAPTFLKMDCEGGEWSIDYRYLRMFRAIEAEIHNFDRHDPRKFVTMLENIGFKVKSWKTPECQLMISARRI